MRKDFMILFFLLGLFPIPIFSSQPSPFYEAMVISGETRMFEGKILECDFLKNEESLSEGVSSRIVLQLPMRLVMHKTVNSPGRDIGYLIDLVSGCGHDLVGKRVRIVGRPEFAAELHWHTGAHITCESITVISNHEK